MSAQDAVIRKNSSFYPAMRDAKPQQQRLLFALYDLCRVMDDAVDDAPTQEAAHAAIAFWREEIESSARGAASTPQTRDLQIFLQEMPALKTYALDMLEGFAMDASGQMITPSQTVLDLYCYRVAGTAGAMAALLLGAPSQPARDYAISLGCALQYVNILRDVREDAARGRVYFPAPWLEKHEIPSGAAALGTFASHHAQWRRLQAGWAAMAREALESARPAALSAEETAALAPAQHMQEAYLALLARLNF